MANSYKNIIITPNIGSSTDDPKIQFSGANTTSNTDITLKVYPASNGTLSFEGSAGQLFSITNDLNESIFSVNDVSGIPSIDVYANGNILLAPFGGQIFVGNTANVNFDSTASTKIVEPAANTLAFHTTQAERFRIDDSGRVLIGTSSARANFLNNSLVSAALQVEGASAAGSIVAVVRNAAGTAAPRFLLAKSRGATIGSNSLVQSGDGIGTVSFQGSDGSEFVEGAQISGVIDGTAGTDSMPTRLEFHTSSTATLSERMRLDSSGNLIINRTDSIIGARVKLDVNGAANVANILVNGDMALTTQNYNSYAPTLTGTGASGTWSINVTGSAGSATTASQLGGVAASSYMRTDSGQTVSARHTFTSSQTATLQNASGSLGGLEVYSAGASAAAFMCFHRPGAYASYFGIDTDNNFAVGGWSAGSALGLMKVGSFGVGTAASGTAGEIRATNNITAYYSDKRLKTNIKKIEFALEKVNKISGVTFQSNDEAAKYGYTDTKTQVGVIAQEIEAVLPEVVVPAPFDIEKDTDGTEYSKSGQNYKTVQYEKLVPLLIEAIKELSGQVADLQNQIEDLKNK